MDISEEIKMAYKIANTQINVFPYPHLYVKNVFTDEYYAQIIKHLPHFQMLMLHQDPTASLEHLL